MHDEATPNSRSTYNIGFMQLRPNFDNDDRSCATHPRFYSGRLDLRWHSKIAGVPTEFVLFLGFNVVSTFFRGKASSWLGHLAGNW